jgi:hypothetical protein
MPWRGCHRRGDADLLAVYEDLTGICGRHTENRLGNIRTAGADKAGKEQDLASAVIEGYVADDPIQCEIAHRKHGITDGHRLLRKHRNWGKFVGRRRRDRIGLKTDPLILAALPPNLPRLPIIRAAPRRKSRNYQSDIIT